MLLRAAVEVNQQARSRFVAKIQRALNGKLAKRRIAVLGLAFKPGTDDVRQAASIDVIRHLEDLGAVGGGDRPGGGAKRAAAAPEHGARGRSLRCVIGADAVVVVTEWPEYVSLDWARVATLVRRRLVVDGRNCLPPIRSSSSASRTSGWDGRLANPKRPKRSRLPATRTAEPARRP